jgi:hypothetical protein
MATHVSQLDDATRDYLEYVASRSRSARERCPGVFVRRPGGFLSGPRGGRVLLTVLGLLALAVAGFFSIASDVPRDSLRFQAGVIGFFTGLGLLLLMSGIVRFLRQEPAPNLGNFVFADSCRVWVVTNGSVTTTEYADGMRVGGKHWYENGAYKHTLVRLWTPRAGEQSWRIPNRRGAEELVGFLRVIAALRDSEDPDVRSMVAAGSGHLGLLARSILNEDPRRPNPDDPVVDPPEPYEVGGSAPSGPGWLGMLFRWAAAGAVAVGLSVGLSVLFDYRREEQLFARIPTPLKGNPTELTAIDGYLKEFPSEGRSDLVRMMRDDHLFEAAKRDAAAADSPAGLRRYLAEPANVRHRADAQVMINTYYDRVVADLKARGEKDKENVDEQLFAAMITLVESLRDAKDPVITVGFVADVQPDPVSAAEKKREKARYDECLESERRLKDVEKRLGGSAILPYQQAFEPDQVRVREDVIFARVSEAVTKAIKADVLTLRKAAPDEKPVIEVRYKISPSGSLFVYTQTDDGFGAAGRTRVTGLLRGYKVAWTITVRPLGGRDPIVYEVNSRPLNRLSYDSKPGDPEWAPYAILLYSAFYDLSDRMIRGFALDPGTPPNSFSFDAAAGHKEPPPVLGQGGGLEPNPAPKADPNAGAPKSRPKKP